ncbi:MAG: succinate dehydrogenase cytochrome b subunit [Rhodothermaceae bacterium]|nr:succinate dehydrogenase cytochrome b subunit [Rhodothermaceae bacterium]
MSTQVREKQPLWRQLFTSQIGKKLLTGLTGLGLTLFVIVHMAGNLSYFAGNEAYNAYAHKLLSLGPLLYIAELGLLAFFVFHIVLGVNIYLGKRKAREQGYKRYKTAGGQSKQSLSSRSMIVTGVILGVFLVLHLVSFKFGAYYEAAESIDGKPVRDLARLLNEKFQSPLYAFGYSGVMVLLALHLRHGIWSAFQSLGATNPRLTPLIYTLGALVGLLIAVGFFILPLWIFFTGGNA